MNDNRMSEWSGRFPGLACGEATVLVQGPGYRSGASMQM